MHRIANPCRSVRLRLAPPLSPVYSFLTVRLVLDTNTVLALWHYQDPALNALRSAVNTPHVVLLAREDALSELVRVLNYPQFKLTEQAQSALFTHYAERVQLCPPNLNGVRLPLCRDPDDQKFLEIARDGAAHALLTRDKLLLKLNRHRTIRAAFSILKPEDFSV